MKSATTTGDTAQAAFADPGTVYEAKNKRKINNARWASLVESMSINGGRITAHVDWVDAPKRNFKVIIFINGFLRFCEKFAVYESALAEARHRVERYKEGK